LYQILGGAPGRISRGDMLAWVFWGRRFFFRFRDGWWLLVCGPDWSESCGSDSRVAPWALAGLLLWVDAACSRQRSREGARRTVAEDRLPGPNGGRQPGHVAQTYVNVDWADTETGLHARGCWETRSYDLDQLSKPLEHESSLVVFWVRPGPFDAYVDSSRLRRRAHKSYSRLGGRRPKNPRLFFRRSGAAFFK